MTRSAASATSNQPIAAASIHAAPVCGRLRRSAPAGGTSAASPPAAYVTSPASATHRQPASNPATATARPGAASRKPTREARRVPSGMRVRRTVGHSVNNVPSTVRPTQPSRFTSACAACSRSCTTPCPAWAASSPPRTPPAASAAAADTYQPITCPNRPGSACRTSRTSTAACHSTTPTISAAPAAATCHGPRATPASTATVATLSTASLNRLPRPDGVRTRSSATVKCSLQMRMAVLTAPSRNTWISSQRGAGSSSPASATATVRPSQATTIAFARRCHDARGRRGGAPSGCVATVWTSLAPSAAPSGGTAGRSGRSLGTGFTPDMDSRSRTSSPARQGPKSLRPRPIGRPLPASQRVPALDDRAVPLAARQA